MEINKKILAIDLVLVLGSLLVIAGLVGYTQPKVIAPIDDYVSTNGNVLFEFKKADLILIDDNIKFSSPTEIHVKDGILVNLKPGNYYWKIIGVFESEVRQLTIKSEIELRLNEKEDGNYEVVNSGNTKLNVDVYNNGKLTGKVALNPGETDVKKGNKFLGGQNDSGG